MRTAERIIRLKFRIEKTAIDFDVRKVCRILFGGKTRLTDATNFECLARTWFGNSLRSFAFSLKSQQPTETRTTLHHETQEKIGIAFQTVRTLLPADCVAEKMGTMLGRDSLLQRKMSTRIQAKAIVRSDTQIAQRSNSPTSESVGLHRFKMRRSALSVRASRIFISQPMFCAVNHE